MKKRLTLLIFTACAVFVGSVGLIFWALAATQVNVTSGLLVTYTPTPQVVCDTSATYQRTNDSSAIAFKNGNLSFGYGGTTTNATLEATSSALQLDDSNTYVVFEFTFQNKNLMENYNLTITLTDNGTVTNMTRKYYFGDLSSSNISAKRTTIKNSGISNSSLSSKKLVLGYQETGRIYMLLEITPGTSASYLADNTNKFAFTLTTAEHVEVEAVAYLTRNWTSRIGDDTSLNTVTTSIIFTKDSSKISGLSNSVSVGTNSLTSTDGYTATTGVEDVTAYWGSDKSTIVIYSPGTIYAPQDSSKLFTIGLTAGGPGTAFMSLETLVLSNFDTSKVTSMSIMFYVCSSLTSLDVSNFNTSKVTNMEYMFSYCSSLTSLDVSNFDTSKVTNMKYMFYNCYSLTSLDVSNFDTSKVTNMKYMFYNCSLLTSLDVSNFNTSNVTDMAFMFYYCKSLTSLDVSNFDTSNVMDMTAMFCNCSSLTSLDVRNFNTSNVTNMEGIFNSCYSLTSLNLGNFNLASCTNFSSMLYSCSALASITLPYNLQSGQTIDLPASTYYNGSVGPYSTIGTATSGTTVACSTADTKVTLTKQS